MTMTVLLVRHGQTDSNVNGFYMGYSGEDLNDTGYTQARCLSLRLASLPIAFVYSSPLRRTLSTATMLAEPHRLEPTVLDDLIEIRLGDWQGLHIDEIERRWPKLWRQWRSDPSGMTLPNGENLDEVTERATRAFQKIAVTEREGLSVIVTHEVIIKVIVIHALGAAHSIYRRFELNNASLSTVHNDNGVSRLALLNDTSHLED